MELPEFLEEKQEIQIASVTTKCFQDWALWDSFTMGNQEESAGKDCLEMLGSMERWMKTENSQGTTLPISTRTSTQHSLGPSIKDS